MCIKHYIKRCLIVLATRQLAVNKFPASVHFVSPLRASVFKDSLTTEAQKGRRKGHGAVKRKVRGL
jgi:hypothetical protein